MLLFTGSRGRGTRGRESVQRHKSARRERRTETEGETNRDRVHIASFQRYIDVVTVRERLSHVGDVAIGLSRFRCRSH